MGLDKDEGRVFESAGISGGGSGLLGEDGGSGGAAEHDVVHLIELEMRIGWIAGKSERNRALRAIKSNISGGARRDPLRFATQQMTSRVSTP